MRELLFLSGGNVTGDVASVPAPARGPPMPSPGEDCWQISPPLPVDNKKERIRKIVYTFALTCQYFKRQRM